MTFCELRSLGLDAAYLQRVYGPEPDDFDSPLIQRCAVGIDLGATEDEVLQLCYNAGQSPEHARLTYLAAVLLRSGSKELK